MNLSNVFIKEEWETMAGGTLLSEYENCVWLPSTKTILYSTRRIDKDADFPVRFGSFELESKSLYSLVAQHKSCKEVVNLAYHHEDILICCRGGVTILSLVDANFKQIFEIVDYSLLCGVFHPDGTMWFSAEWEGNHRETIICRVLSDKKTVINVDINLLSVWGLIQPHFLRWSSDGQTCYMSCAKKMRIFAVDFSESFKISKVRPFSFTPLLDTIIGLNCDPFGNVVVATQHLLVIWDRYGHLLEMMEYRDAILDFALTDREIILMHAMHWSRLRTEFHRRSVSKFHLLDARM